jgi:hypothetical protein
MILQRKSDIFLCSILLGVLLLGLMFLDATVSQGIDREGVRERRAIVKVLALTDLCLFTEARYTRHPSMADRHAPFQDHPLGLDHFPSGAIMAAPPHLLQQDGGE